MSSHPEHQAQSAAPLPRLAILATHPIQYHIPWYRGLAASGEVELKVFYGLIPDAQQQGVGFGQHFQWDIPLLEGYRWELLENRAAHPGLEGFWGCRVAGLSAALREWGAEMVLITGWHAFALLQGVWSARRLGLPMLVRGDSNAMRHRAGWKSIVQGLLMKQFDGYLVVGRSNREFYLRLGVDEKRFFRVPHFIDNQRFADALQTPTAPSVAELRERYRIPRDTLCFIYSGKLNHKKRILDLLYAMAKLKQRKCAAHLLVVGSGELMEAAQTLVEEQNLAVSFVGFLNQSEIPLAYHAADVLVLPSDYGET